MAALYSLKFRIAATIFVLEGVMMGFTLWQVLGALQTSIERQIVTQEQVTLDLLKGLSLQALVTEEFVELQPMFESLQRDQRIVRAVLADDKGRIVAASNPTDLGGNLPELRADGGAYWRTQDIGRTSVKLGRLALEFSQATLESANTRARNLGIAIATSCMIFIAFVGIGAGLLLTRRLDRLRIAAQQVAEGDLTVRTAFSGRDEIAELSKSFDQMAIRIGENQKALRLANAVLEVRVEERTSELTQTVDELRQTQEHLVQSEKLAALGRMVAGIAHELNTPIGNAMMVASSMHEKGKELATLLETDGLKRSTLIEYSKANIYANELAMRSLSQAAELVSSFKRVAVDQASVMRREFLLEEMVEEVLSTLRHQLKGGGIRLELDLGEGINMHSFPGPLGQVIANLFNNALIHAFEGRETGCIRIETRLQNEEEVVLRFSDDGAGIEEKNLGKIFDPFFTTKFGRGGSGLGLNITHNIVTGILGGRISVVSRLGRGTTFTLTFPLIAPLAANNEST